MSKISFSPAIQNPAQVWDILTDHPEARFTLEIVQTEPMFRISLGFDPMTDDGTRIAYAFGTPLNTTLINAWIRVSL